MLKYYISSIVAGLIIGTAVGNGIADNIAADMPVIPETSKPAHTVTYTVTYAAEAEKTKPNRRYAGLDISAGDIETIAEIVYLEARGESADGQQAVAEVILNRVLHKDFPDNVSDVINQKNQFTSAKLIDKAKPTEAQYSAVYEALYGENILDTDVVFFATSAENDRIFKKIGNHVFCREYVWSK